MDWPLVVLTAGSIIALGFGLGNRIGFQEGILSFADRAERWRSILLR